MKLFFSCIGMFAFFFGIGWYLSSTAPKESAPQLPIAPQAAAPTTAPVPAQPAAPVLNAAELLLKGKGGALFGFLFDEEGLRGKDFADIEPMLSTRFRRAYPSAEPEFQQELVSRLGILKALGETYGEEATVADRQSLMTFYRELALRQKENLMVRRQALRNLSAWIKTLPEKKRNELISRMPASLVASAAFSERELLTEVFTHAK